MALVEIAVERIKAAAEQLEQIDPDRQLKDPVNQAIRLGAAQLQGGKVTIGSDQAARIDELLAPPQPAAEASSQPVRSYDGAVVPSAGSPQWPDTPNGEASAEPASSDD